MTQKPLDSFTTRFFLLFFVFIILLNISLFSGLFHALSFAAICSGCFYPLFLKLEKRMRKKELAALITTILLVLCLVLPFTYLVIKLSKETVNLYYMLSETFSKQEIQRFFFEDGLGAQAIKTINQALDLDINPIAIKDTILESAQMITGKAVKIVNRGLSQTITFAFQFLVMLIACYGFFMEGSRLKSIAFKLSPLPDDQEQMLLDKFSQMNFVTLVCNGIGGVIQGVLAGFGLWLCGVESLFLWTTLMIIFAFIPLLGISIVTAPASFFIILSGDKLSGVLFLVLTSAMAIYIENFFKPRFIGKRIQVNSIVLLLYIIAGLGTFGMAGIFYGPILCTLFLTMIDLFEKHYLPHLTKSS